MRSQGSNPRQFVWNATRSEFVSEHQRGLWDNPDFAITANSMCCSRWETRFDMLPQAVGFSSFDESLQSERGIAVEFTPLPPASVSLAWQNCEEHV